MTGRSVVLAALAASLVTGVGALTNWPTTSTVCTSGQVVACTSSSATVAITSGSVVYTNCIFQGCPLLTIAGSGTSVTFNNVTVDGTNAPATATWDALIRVSSSASVVATDTVFQNMVQLGANETNRYGGAFYLSASTFTGTNVVFNNNQAIFGSAIAGINSAISCTGCSFISNGGSPWMIAKGGAIYTLATSTLTLSSSTFTNNTAVNSGGALYLVGTTGTASDLTFTNNAAQQGGSLWVTTPNTYTCNRCSFIGDGVSVAGKVLGGSVYVDKGASFVWNTGSCVGSIVGTVVTPAGAQTGKGGCLFAISDSGTVTNVNLTNVVFRDSLKSTSAQVQTSQSNTNVYATGLTFNNITSSGSGAAFTGYGVSYFTNSVFTNLYASTGGAIGLSGNTGSTPYLIPSSTLTNCTIANTSAPNGGAFYVTKLAKLYFINSSATNVTSLASSGTSGGGLVSADTGAYFSMTNSTVTGAYSGTDGGIARIGTTATSGNATFFGCYGSSTMTGSTHGNGGCVFNSASNVDISDSCTITTCLAGASGGGIYNVASGNATVRGGASILLSYATTFGGGIALNGPNANVHVETTATIQNNTAVICGGGIDTTSDSYLDDSGVIKYNIAPCGPAACLRNTTNNASSGSLLVDSTATRYLQRRLFERHHVVFVDRISYVDQ
ncbi:hypothetical protein HKX48_007536 [Thoreauomyces humboldtii]|nr:hypothetical protein HKX48_007536 [Thoreauomyces humboldtii]